MLGIRQSTECDFRIGNDGRDYDINCAKSEDSILLISLQCDKHENRNQRTAECCKFDNHVGVPGIHNKMIGDFRWYG